MKLTEAKLKQLIMEMMSQGPLPHLDNITGMFAKSLGEAMQAMAFIEVFDAYTLKGKPSYDNDGQRLVINLRFKDPNVAKQVYDALLDKGVENANHWSPEGPTASLRIYSGQYLSGGSIQLYHPVKSPKQDLGEIKSNLSSTNKKQLQADLELVKKLDKEEKALRADRDEVSGNPGGTALADKLILGITHDPDSDIGQIDALLKDINNQLNNMAIKYNIGKYFNNEELIHRMNHKFRRKDL